MPDGEIPYSFRVAHPDLLQRGRDQVVRLEVYHQGGLVAPAGTSTFSLLRPDGSAVVNAAAVTISDEVATYAISGSTELADTDTNPYSELYQERWILDLPDGTRRTIRREAAVAPFSWYNPVADVDLLAEYPELGTLVGPLEQQTLQGFIDESVRHVLELLFNQGQWPDIMVSVSAFREPIRQRALFLIFKDLYREQGGAGNPRWERLLRYHEGEWNAAWARLSSRLDADLDGHADSTDRQAARRTIHRNAHGRRARVRTARW